LLVLGKIPGRDPSVLDLDPKHCFEVYCTSGKLYLHRIQLFKTPIDVLIFEENFSRIQILILFESRILCLGFPALVVVCVSDQEFFDTVGTGESIA
jgi:hypothetical protein